MNNLIKIENKEIKVNIRGYLLDYIDLYELVSEMSYEVHKYGLSNLLDLVNLAKSITPKKKELPFLENSIRELILRNFQNGLSNEFDIHDLARSNLTKVIPGCKIIKRRNNPQHQPGLWISIGAEKIPVEVKLHDFDLKALEQLERYMQFYKSKKGVGVARSISIKLPSNIKFISIEELEGKHNE